MSLKENILILFMSGIQFMKMKNYVLLLYLQNNLFSMKKNNNLKALILKSQKYSNMTLKNLSCTGYK